MIPGLAQAPSTSSRRRLKTSSCGTSAVFNRVADLPETLIAGREAAPPEFRVRPVVPSPRPRGRGHLHRYGPIRRRAVCAAASPTTARFRKRCGRTANAQGRQSWLMPVLAIGAEHATNERAAGDATRPRLHRRLRGVVPFAGLRPLHHGGGAGGIHR
ncbi:hypothetical protein ACU4GD_18970 [Cupriavidus basilensis]